MVAGVVVAVLVWAGIAAVLLLRAQSSLEAGRAELDAVRNGATPATLLDPETGEALDRAAAAFDQARSSVRNPILTPLRMLPVTGRHVRAVDRLVSGSQGATDLARVAVDDLDDLRDAPLAGGPDRLAALDSLAAVVDRLRDGLDELEVGSGDALVGPLGEAVSELEAERVESIASLDRAVRVVESVRGVLAGPTDYLLLGANNAEMRAGSGMFLSAAPVGFADGAITLGDVRPSEELVLPAGAVADTGQVGANWPFLDAGRDFRSMGLTADFPQTGPIAAANWAQVPGGGAVAGVIVVDVDALRGLLQVVGPVEVDGVTYRADDVRGQLLREQYADFDDQGARRDQVGAVARAVFARIEAGEFELDQLSSALIDAAVRRNLMVWSIDEATQQAWADAGVDGRLRDDSVSVAMLNRGAEKLDSYLDTEATMTSTPGPDGRVIMTVTYRITNGAPEFGPRYVIGPNIDGLEAGEHRGIVVANVPGGSTDVTIEGVEQTLLASDGPTEVVAGAIALERGESAEVEVQATLPEGVDQVRIEPSARISPTKWTAEGTSFEIDRRRTVTLGG